MGQQIGFVAPLLPIRRYCTVYCDSQMQSRSTLHMSSTGPAQKPVSRRHMLMYTSALASLSILPDRANALSKKRILAKAGPTVELPSGITYRDITVGKGFTPRDGDTVAIHYSLFYKDLEVESSRESQGLAASPVGFTFGAKSGPGSIIPGINLGMEGMKVGGLRLITVPPQLAYGEKGKKPLIPSNSTVEFAVSLLSVKRSGTNPISTINPKAQVF
eukprot:GFKZ01002591.1.p1 GENE.GFKZ01002591.1~~GFKZ01002591.1.p1  ORF type:complete len:217 (-),score=25.61 GFKZ01002591.1:279-929(-)